MKWLFLILIWFSSVGLVSAQTWTQKRANWPTSTNPTGTYDTFNVPGFDTQSFLLYIPEEQAVCTYQASAADSGGEWGNGVYCYDPSADDGTSTGKVAGTGWRLLNSSGDAQKSDNAGVHGAASASPNPGEIVSIACNSGVVTVNVLSASAQFVTDGTLGDGRTASWIGIQGLPAGWANGMHQITGVSNAQGTSTWEASRLFKTYTWADATCPSGTTLSDSTTLGSGSAPIVVQGTIDELPSQPQRRHAEGAAYGEGALYVTSGIADNNIDATIENATHAGTLDLYKATKTANSGANWAWNEQCGFGGSQVGVTNSALLPSTPGPGHLCGQQFLTTSTTNVGVNGLFCLDSGIYGTGVSTNGSTNCSFRMVYEGYDATNHVLVMFGGSNGPALQCETILYYPATDTWKSLTNGSVPTCGTSTTPAARWNQAGSKLASIGGGKLFLFGGTAAGNAFLTDTWILNTNGCSTLSAPCGWTQASSTSNPAANNGSLNSTYDWVSSIRKVVYVDAQSPAHIWYFDPSAAPNGQWADQGNGTCDPVAGCPSLTQSNSGNPYYSTLAAYDAHTDQLVVMNLCNTTTVPACASINKQIWTLSFGGAQSFTAVTTQEGLPSGATGVNRTKEPVTVGLPLADSLGISGTLGAAPTNIGGSGSPTNAYQFRCLADWDSGHCKWVEFDYLDSLLAGGTDGSVSLTSGSGNVGANLATDNGTTISVNTGTGGCAFTVQKANFDVLHSVVCNAKTLVNGGSDGLALMGPTFQNNAAGTVCTFNSTCTTKYSSAQDASSTCSIEENGPVRVALKCTGALKDSLGNAYMKFLVRLHFFLGQERVRTVVTLKNADDGASGSFPISYKGYESFKLSLKTQLTGTDAYAIAGDGINVASGTLSAGQSAYIYAGYQKQYAIDPGGNDYPGTAYDLYNGDLQFGDAAGTTTRADAAQDITRTGCFNSSTCVYAQDGYIVVNPAGTIALSGTDAVMPIGWADVKDSTSGAGITFGTDYMGANFPRSLEVRNGGQEIDIGISPDQVLWTGTCGTGATPCKKIYFQPWPYYKIANVDLIFHDSDTNAYSETGNTRSQNDFYRMQFPLIAQAPRTYYNSSGALEYPLPDPVAVDNYMNNTLGARFAKTYSALNDCQFLVTRWYQWNAGGAGNQQEYRYDNLVQRWLERGQDSCYLYTRWFDRFQEQYAWERGDDISCAGGKGWACHTPSTDLDPYTANPSACTNGPTSNKCSFNAGTTGMLPNNCTSGSGCVGGYADPVANENSTGRHYHWWSALFDYLMTGDEDLHDMITGGVTTEYSAVGTNDNYAVVTANGSLATTPRYRRAWVNATTTENNRLSAEAGSVGTQLLTDGFLWRFFTDTGDSTNAGFVDTMTNNMLNVILHEDTCATTGIASTDTSTHWPVGCAVSTSGSPGDQSTRGFSTYRGIYIGSNDINNFDRAVPANCQTIANTGASGVAWPSCTTGTGCGTGNACTFARSGEAFLQAMLTDGLLALTDLRGSSWTYYQELRDLAYGDALSIDQTNFISNISGSPNVSTSQLIYTMGFDQPDSIAWASSADQNGQSPPFASLYHTLATYTGTLTPWQTHFEDTAINLACCNPNSGNLYGSYGGHIWDQIINDIMNPPTATLQTVIVTASASPIGCTTSCTWRLTWTAPIGVQQYFLKENDSKTIVDNIGWNVTTNQPSDTNVANDYNWFAVGNNIETAPSAGQSSTTVSAPSTAHFMLKAFSTGIAPPSNTVVTVTSNYGVQIGTIGITTSSLPTATHNVAYSTTLTAQGGAGTPTITYSWSVVYGALPSGITLNSTTGVISGTTSQTGTFDVVIRVSDTIGHTGRKDLPLTVN